MPDFYKLYARSPVFAQNVATALYGVRERVRRYGGQYGQFLSALRQSEWLSAEELDRLQRDRLRAMIKFCAERVPHYRDLFRSIRLSPEDIKSVTDLKALPILEKETVRATPSRFVPEVPKERPLPQTTGGTTGTPLRYFATSTAIQFNYAAYEVRCRNWAGVSFGERVAAFTGKAVVPMQQTRPPYWRHNPAFNQLYFSPYHLNQESLCSYVERLRTFRPIYIAGYVSTVHAVARFMLDQGLEGAVLPRAILVSSETLFDHVRQDLQNAFRCDVFDAYSLGELVALISECPQHQLHVSPEYGVVELVGLDGDLELICTGLMNYAMPLIRYRTGDVAEPGPPDVCDCGRELPRIRRILGRVDDRVVTPRGSVVGPAALSLAFQAVPRLKMAQIHQETPLRIEVLVVPAEGYTRADEGYLLAQLRQRLGDELQIAVRRVDEIERTIGGKQRLVVSSVPPRNQTKH